MKRSIKVYQIKKEEGGYVVSYGLDLVKIQATSSLHALRIYRESTKNKVANNGKGVYTDH